MIFLFVTLFLSPLEVHGVLTLFSISYILFDVYIVGITILFILFWVMFYIIFYLAVCNVELNMDSMNNPL